MWAVVAAWVNRSRRSAARYAAYIPVTPSQRSGSGSHRRTSWLTHGRAVSSVAPACPESCRTRSRNVRAARFAVATPEPT